MGTCLSGGNGALYLIPGELMKKFGTFNVIGWGMLIGGIFLCVFINLACDRHVGYLYSAGDGGGNFGWNNFVLYNIYGRCSTNWGI